MSRTHSATCGTPIGRGSATQRCGWPRQGRSSYLRQNDDIVLSALSAGAIKEVFEVSFGGLITVTAAFVFLGASGPLGGTFALGFTSLLVVFTHLGAWERPIGAAWFLLLSLAALTSSVSMLQPARAFLQEALGCSAKRERCRSLRCSASVVRACPVMFEL